MNPSDSGSPPDPTKGQPGPGQIAVPIHQLEIDRIQSNEVRSGLTARVTHGGELVLAGFDAGPRLREFMGVDEYEYWLTIPSEFRDSVLLHLVKDRFASVYPMREWLDSKGIPCRLESY